MSGDNFNEKKSINQIYIKGLCWIDVKNTHFSFRFQGIPKDQHFTVSYNSPKGYVELHITKNVQGDSNNKPKIPLLRINKKQLLNDSEKLIQSLLLNVIKKVDDNQLNSYEQFDFFSFGEFENNKDFEKLNQNLLGEFKNLIKIRKKSRAEIKGDFIKPILSFTQSENLVNLIEDSISKFDKSKCQGNVNGVLITEEDYIPIFLINNIWYEFKKELKLTDLLAPILEKSLIKRIEWKIKRTIIHLKSINSYKESNVYSTPINLYKKESTKNSFMKEEKKYYGEVSLTSKIEDKCFAIIELKDDQIQIETNLIKSNTDYGIEIIYGIIVGLGYVTFIDCRVNYNESGIANARIYHPKYTFVSPHHFIDINKLVIDRFTIENSIIVDWFYQTHYFNYSEDKLVKINDENIPIYIKEKKLRINIKRTTSYNSNHKEFVLKNIGLLKFHSEKKIKLIEAIEYYNGLQKVFHFLYKGSFQFSRFSFKCLGCGEWVDFYYKDSQYNNINTNYVNFHYEAVKTEINKIISTILTKENIMFCINLLMENFIAKKISHNKRFTNSIASFEGFSKIYTKGKNTKLNGYLNKQKDLIQNIAGISNDNFNLFITKIIRSRDYYIHSNLKQKNLFSEFDLLYISFLLDFITIYNIFQKIEVSEDILKKTVLKAKSVYIDMQNTNKHLSKDSLKGD